MMEQMLTTQEVAEKLGINPLTLVHWRRQKRGPAYVRVENTIRYPVSAIATYLAERTVATETAEDQR